MPDENKLRLDQTFKTQRSLVTNTIVPTVMRTLDSEMFSVAEGIVYEIIHNRHKHRREEHLKRQQSSEHQDKQSRRKHLNSRRNNVSK